MSNLSLTALTLAALVAAPAMAEDNFQGKVGFGFQGVVMGNYLNGASVRGWTSGKFGWEGNLLYGNLKASAKGSSMTANGEVTALEGKGMYPLVTRPNSRMFIGGKLLYGHYNLDASDETIIKGNLWAPGVFAGAEWCIPQLPEVAFNFEVGYNYMATKPTIMGSDLDLKLQGINAAVGVHYNF